MLRPGCWGLKSWSSLCFFLLAVELMWDITQFLLFHISQSHWIFLFRGQLWNLSIAHFVAEAVPVCSASCSKRIVFRRPFEKIYHRQVSSSLFRSTKGIVTKNNAKFSNIYHFSLRYQLVTLTIDVLRGPAPAMSRRDKAQAANVRSQWTASRLKHIYAHVP